MFDEKPKNTENAVEYNGKIIESLDFEIIE